MDDEDTVNVTLTIDDLRYIIRCGAALVQNIPANSLHTYCGYDKDEIIEFSAKMRQLLDDIGEDL